jgi:hypothetical protein
MGKQTVYVCDYHGCNQMQKDTNNWIIAIKKEAEIAFMWLEGHEDLLEAEYIQAELKVLCSRECAQKVLERYLQHEVNDSSNDETIRSKPELHTFEEARKTAEYLKNYPRF